MRPILKVHHATKSSHLPLLLHTDPNRKEKRSNQPITVLLLSDNLQGELVKGRLSNKVRVAKTATMESQRQTYVTVATTCFGTM